MYKNSVYEYIERIFLSNHPYRERKPSSSDLVGTSPPKKERQEMFSSVTAVNNGENKKKTSTRLNFHRLLKEREHRLEKYAFPQSGTPGLEFHVLLYQQRHKIFTLIVNGLERVRKLAETRTEPVLLAIRDGNFSESQRTRLSPVCKSCRLTRLYNAIT